MVLSTVALLCAVALAALGIRGWLPIAVNRLRKPLAAAALLVASILVLLTGGTTPSLAAIGIAAWGMAEVFGVGLGSASFALAALSAALALVNRQPPALAVGGAILAVAIGALPYFYARRIAAVHARRERRVTRLEAQIARPTPARPLPTEALKREVLLSVERTEATKDLAILDGFLRDVRDLIQADEAIFWRWSEERDTLIPQAWSTEDSARPEYFRVKEWGPLARWSAQERLPTFDGNDETVLLAAAPVLTPGVEEGATVLQGVVTVTCNSGLALEREALKNWLPRFANQLAGYLSCSICERTTAAVVGEIRR